MLNCDTSERERKCKAYLLPFSNFLVMLKNLKSSGVFPHAAEDLICHFRINYKTFFFFFLFL